MNVAFVYWIKVYCDMKWVKYAYFSECINFEQRMSEMQRQQGEEHEFKSFYNGMLIAAIIATVAILSLIIVTSLYLKRTTTYKAIISGGKKSEYAFTNKAFTTVSI